MLIVLLGWHLQTLAEIDEDLVLKEKKPLYELGLGAGSGYFPHYPASQQGRWQSAALPTIRYRGLFFRADEEDGVRAKIISDPRYGIELSGSGALPASSSEIVVRHGMPDLDLLGEAGPQFYLRLQRDGFMETRILFPFRAAVTTNFANLKFQGYTFSPGIEVRMLLPNSLGAVRLKINATYASDEYHRYYYDVPALYATAERPAYQAKAGYMGTRTELGYSAEWDRFAIFAQVALTDFRQAANSASPLFRDEKNISGLFGIRWLLYESVAREDEKY